MLPDPNSNAERGRHIRNLLILAALCVVIVAVLGFNYFRYWSKPAPAAAGRSIQAFTTTWRCVKCGHELDDRGAAGTRPCPKCGGEMYIRIQYACGRHGAFPVLFLYDAENKQSDPTKIRVGDGEWVPYADEDYNINIRCPRCGVEMMPAEASRPAP